MSRGSHRGAVFLDRDGTICRYREYCCRPEDFQLLPGVGKAIRRLNNARLLVIVITNQSAIARGWLAWDTLEQIHQTMRCQLARVGAIIDEIYVCPHHPDDGCACRKPGIALFKKAAEDLTLSLKHSYAVGDRYLDVLAGRSSGITSILVRSGHDQEPSHGVVPDFEAQSLVEAIDWIIQQEALRAPQVRRPATRADMAVR